MRLNIRPKRPKAGYRTFLPAVLIAAFFAFPTALFAQGSITGTVQNADLSVPANGELSFFGFLDQTDEEVRIETCDGAGYESGNWYDDFQNYLTEASGSPYVYYFANLTNGQAYQLSKTIPANSFQVENIVLTAASLPARPANVTARPLSTSRMLITWNGATGLTYHVYRRAASSNGSFFRIDNPLGSLSDIGEADTFFVDANVDGVSSYTYMIIAQTAAGVFSPHSAPVTASSATPFAPTLVSISPTSGVANGGTLVHLYGTGFDAAGVTVNFGTSSATSVTVLSPQHITVNSPAGAGTVDVSVTNTASSLSATLTAAFTYFGNTPPVANAGADQLSQYKNTTITLDGSASSDVDLDPLAFHWRQVSGPATVVLSDSNIAQPTFVASANGDYVFELKVSDPYSISNADSVLVRVVERAPILATIGPRGVNEGANLNFVVTATDPDGQTPAMTAQNVPTNATYVDNGNGTGTFNFNPDYAQQGVYNVTFIASDGVLADTELVAITVTENNRPPVLAAIGARSVNEGANLNFSTSATDPDGQTPVMIAENVPTNAAYTDNGNGTGTFNFNPDYTQAGVFNVRFIASDGTMADTEIVAITVANVNRAPVLAAIGAQSVNEGATLNFATSASDLDGGMLVMTAENVPTNATYTDNNNGTGTFNFTPDYTQAGVFNVRFIASDGTMADTELVAITVTDIDRAPVLATIGPRGVNEGANLNFTTSANDPDGPIPVLTAEDLPTHATYVDNGNGSGTFDFNPDFTQAGVYNVRFIATSGALADSETVTITVADAANQRPVLAAIGARSVNEGTTLAFVASATDPDGTNPTMLAVNLPTNATYIDNGDGTAAFTFTPDYTQAGVHNVIFIASDGVLADSETVAITVIDANQVPVLATIGPRSVLAGSNLTFNTSATDADGQIPVMTAVNLPAHATYVDHLNGTGTFVFVPDLTQFGVYNVTFIASDGIAADSEIVPITVTNTANQPPVLDSIGPKIVYEGGVLSFQIHAVDESGIPSLLASAVSMGSHFAFVDEGTGYGTFTYTPDYYDAGVDTVTFFALDNAGASDMEKVFITTLDVNRPPSLSSLPDYTVLPGDSLKIPIVATDSTDANGGALFLISLAKPTTAVFTDSTGGRGSLRWKPTIADTGTHTFIVLCLDDDTPALSDIDTATITVLRTNQPPVLAPIGTKSIPEGDTLEFRLSATDPDGTIPFFYAQGIPVNGTLVDSANGAGSFTFTPTFRQAGLYSVKFFASDGNKNDYETVLIQVVNVPQPPILTVPADTQSVLEGDSLWFTISVTDADSTIDTLKVDAASLPVNASFVDSLNGRGLFKFKPNYTQAGIYTVRFFATDGVKWDTADVVVNCVYAGNQTPKLVANPTAVNTTELSLISIRVRATDADGSIPTLSVLTPLPFDAEFVDSGQGIGRFNWQTANLQAGTYEITFYATDVDTPGVVDSVKVPIVLADFNIIPDPILYDPFMTCPNPADCQQTVAEGGTLQFRIYSADGDLTHPLFRVRRYAIAGNDTTYSAAPANMTLTDLRNDTASFVFTPDYTQNVGSPYNIMFTARDESDTTIRVQTAMRITVTNVSVPAVLDPIGPLSVLEGGTLDVTVTGRDPDGFAVTLTATGMPTGATFTPLSGQPAGIARSRFLYTPGFNAAGVYSTTFRVAETVGGTSATEIVTITVIDAGNQKPVLAKLDTLVSVNVTGDNANIWLRATDPDGTTPVLSVAATSTPPHNGALVDSGNGRGCYRWDPETTQADSSYLLWFVASDGLLADTVRVRLTAILAMRGDANNDGTIDVSDVVFIINYIFSSGEPPFTVRNGDANADGSIDISDATYLVAYIFSSGPPPPL